MKRWTGGEFRFHITSILCKKMSLKEAADLARIIYADTIAPAIAEIDKQWEELNRAKDNDSFN